METHRRAKGTPKSVSLDPWEGVSTLSFEVVQLQTRLEGNEVEKNNISQHLVMVPK